MHARLACPPSEEEGEEERKEMLTKEEGERERERGDGGWRCSGGVGARITQARTHML